MSADCISGWGCTGAECPMLMEIWEDGDGLPGEPAGVECVIRGDVNPQPEGTCIHAPALKKVLADKTYALIAVPESVARRMMVDKAHVGEVVE